MDFEIQSIGDLEHLSAGGFIDDDEYDALVAEYGFDSVVETGSGFSFDDDDDGFDIPF